jgi:hypothetical protein
MKMEEIKIKARDDVRLQSFLFLPAGEGPFPSLLARCMYGADRLEEEARSWAEQGYAVVLQNVRGRHGSEGGPSGGGDYAEDGYDTIGGWSPNLVQQTDRGFRAVCRGARPKYRRRSGSSAHRPWRSSPWHWSRLEALSCSVRCSVALWAEVVQVNLMK